MRKKQELAKVALLGNSISIIYYSQKSCSLYREAHGNRRALPPVKRFWTADRYCLTARKSGKPPG